MIERALQLQSTAADVLQIFAEQTDRALSRNLRASLLDLLFFDQDLACKDQGLRAFARGGQSHGPQEVCRVGTFKICFA